MWWTVGSEIILRTKCKYFHTLCILGFGYFLVLFFPLALGVFYKLQSTLKLGFIENNCLTTEEELHKDYEHYLSGVCF